MARQKGQNVEETEANLLSYISMRTWIDPTEIGDTAVFLASHEARFVSGTALAIDGGSSAGR
ncbi:MAG: SDR family oxidoreductase [Gemmatimonadetes bacterium]|nr:SDR family oxidoreductase [Gemmatimonadota bacterium]